MNINELQRLKDGERVIAKIEKLKKQREALENCNQVKIFGTDKGGKRIDFDFPNSEHPFFVEAVSFIDLYKTFLDNLIKEQQSIFNSL